MDKGEAQALVRAWEAAEARLVRCLQGEVYGSMDDILADPSIGLATVQGYVERETYLAAKVLLARGNRTGPRSKDITALALGYALRMRDEDYPQEQAAWDAADRFGCGPEYVLKMLKAYESN